MIKESQKEAKEIIEKIYEVSPPIRRYFLLRKRSEGLKDSGLKKALVEISKGLRTQDYSFYNDPQTPLLLFEKELLIKKSTLTFSNKLKRLKLHSTPEPLGFEVEPNFDVINKYREYLLHYLLGEEESSKIPLYPIVESKCLKMLSNGYASIKTKDDWKLFADINLEIDENGEISSNTGNLLYYLINQKKLTEDAYLFSHDSIKESLDFTENEYQNAIGSLRSAIKKQSKTTGETPKVKISRKRGTNYLVFANTEQNSHVFQ